MKSLSSFPPGFLLFQRGFLLPKNNANICKVLLDSIYYRVFMAKANAEHHFQEYVLENIGKCTE